MTQIVEPEIQELLTAPTISLNDCHFDLETTENDLRDGEPQEPTTKDAPPSDLRDGEPQDAPHGDLRDGKPQEPTAKDAPHGDLPDGGPQEPTAKDSPHGDLHDGGPQEPTAKDAPHGDLHDGGPQEPTAKDAPHGDLDGEPLEPTGGLDGEPLEPTANNAELKPEPAHVPEPEKMSVGPAMEPGIVQDVEMGSPRPNMDRLTTQSFDPLDASSMLEAVCNTDLVISPDILPCVADQLVLAKPKLPPFENEKAALPLKVCLQHHFTTGTRPIVDELIGQNVVEWMHQLAQTPCHEIWDAEQKRGLDAFYAMRNAAESMHERVSATSATCRAVSEAAQKSFAESVRLFEGMPNKDALLTAKSNTLCKWVSGKQAQARANLDQQSIKHDLAMDQFNDEVVTLVQAAYDSYTLDLKDKDCRLENEENKLIEELEAELEHTMQQCVPQPEHVAQTAETPENPEMVPGSHEYALKEMCSQVCRGLPNVDEVTQKALVENLGDAFRKTLFQPEGNQADGNGQVKQDSWHIIIYMHI